MEIVVLDRLSFYGFSLLRGMPPPDICAREEVVDHLKVLCAWPRDTRPKTYIAGYLGTFMYTIEA